jgi:hypothetical protein
MRVEPKTIINFLSNHFEFLRELFDAHRQEGLLRKEAYHRIAYIHNTDVLNQMLEYKILRKVNDDFEFHSIYWNMLEFILNEFRPFLPETIEKYHHSISSLYKRIREWANGDKVVLHHTLNDLSDEIKSFYESVEKNSMALLKETRDLKANLERIDYREKVLRASRWIDDYIIPLNLILDVNRPESITNKLYEIAHYSNGKRLNFSDESIRLQFEKLYNQLIQTHDNLLTQSKILTNELLPLIERIRTESMILTGFIEFMKNPYRIKTPKLLKTTRSSLYSSSMYLNALEYVEQFLNQEDFYLDTQAEPTDKWIFNKAEYKTKLESELPVEDFFSWCEKTLNIEYQELDPRKFFSLSILLFEKDLHVEFPKEKKLEPIRLNNSILKVPQLKVMQKYDDLFQVPQADS